MTQATFQEICRKPSTTLQRQSRRGTTVREKLCYLFKITKLSPSCLLLTRSGWIGCLWNHQDKSILKAVSCQWKHLQEQQPWGHCLEHGVVQALGRNPVLPVGLSQTQTQGPGCVPRWCSDCVSAPKEHWHFCQYAKLSMRVHIKSSPSTQLQSGFSLSEGLVTNLSVFTWSSFPKWSSHSQSLKFGFGRRSCHCSSAVGHPPAQEFQGNVCERITFNFMLNFALKKLEVLLGGASSWMDGLSGCSEECAPSQDWCPAPLQWPHSCKGTHLWLCMLEYESESWYELENFKKSVLAGAPL